MKTVQSPTGHNNTITTMEIPALRHLPKSELKRIRKQDGRIATHDVIRAVTGQQLKACRTTLHRLLTRHPDLATFCVPFKFNESGPGGNQETPATNAQGIVSIIMCMSGKAAEGFRERASETIVRYLGGDETLVAEIRTNRIAQERLAATHPEHPARLFGEAVERDRPLLSTLTKEQQNSRRHQSGADRHNVMFARLHAITAAKEVADQWGFTVTPN